MNNTKVKYSGESIVEIRNAIQPLKLISWGSLILILDFSFTSSASVNGELSGFRFDVINDFVGMVLITLGIVRLAEFDVDVEYAKIMQFLKVVSLVSCCDAVMNHFLFQHPPFLTFLLLVLGVTQLIAVLLFCLAMMKLANRYDLEVTRESWQTTLILMTLFWIIPSALLHAATLYSLMTGEIVNVQLGGYILVVIGMMLIPVAHFFVSIQRMRIESESAEIAKPVLE